MSLAKTQRLILALLIAVLVFSLAFIIDDASAQTSLDSRSIKINNPEASATPVKYTIGYNIGYAYNIGSIRLQFCENSPLLGYPCDPIPGFDASGASIINQTGINNFSILSANNTEIILSRTSSLIGPINSSIEFNGLVNPSDNGTHFGRIQTFSSEDATGASIEGGGMTFVINEQVDFSAYVPPYLSFCSVKNISGFDCSGATGSFIDMGELSSSNANTATSQFIGQTNAENGFVISVFGKTPTSGNNIINPLAVRSASIPGTNQFGINLRNNSNPDVGEDPIGLGTGSNRPEYNIPNQFRFVSGDAIYSTNTTTLGSKITVTYLINVSSNQKPGVYSTTLLYTALASF